LIEDPFIDVVGGRCDVKISTPFQMRYARYFQGEAAVRLSDYSPSSRNTAFRRKAWASIGGYPEWLTLTAEDSLFNINLHAIGCRYYYEPSAVVRWNGRCNMFSYLKMMYSYGYGSAESCDAFMQYVRCTATMLFFPLIFFSSNPFSDLPFRYLRNSARSLGWLAGKIKGRRYPKGWMFHNGALVKSSSLQTSEEMRIIFAIPLVYSNSGSFWERDLGLVVQALRKTGHDALVLLHPGKRGTSRGNAPSPGIT